AGALRSGALLATTDNSLRGTCSRERKFPCRWVPLVHSAWCGSPPRAAFRSRDAPVWLPVPVPSCSVPFRRLASTPFSALLARTSTSRNGNRLLRGEAPVTTATAVPSVGSASRCRGNIGPS
ncbi:unnamed protein product, partial [Ectocarpus sp. 13 AM-2016]